MDIFKGRYFNINRRLLICHGLWPYEDDMKKYVLRAIIMGTLTLFGITQLISMYMHYNDMDRLMLSIVGFMTLSVLNLKMMEMILAEESMKALHKSIANNWQRIQDHRERNILRKYSERARTATILYITLMVGPGIIAAAVPLIPKILDIVKPLENPRPNIYITAAELFIDRETHFFLFFVLEYIAIILLIFIVVTVDTMYFVSIEHCCALYAIIRFRLLELRPITQKSSPSTEDSDSYEWLRRTIELHQNAQACTSLLNDSYSTTFQFVFIVGLFFIPLDSCAVIANLDNPLHLFPYASLLTNVMIHGFCLSYPGQRIIDHQVSLLDAAYSNEWYATPLRTRKLLLIFMLRCSEPVTITAGDLLPMNIEVYFMVAKTAVSYITVASSFR